VEIGANLRFFRGGYPVTGGQSPARSLLAGLRRSTVGMKHSKGRRRTFFTIFKCCIESIGYMAQNMKIFEYLVVLGVVFFFLRVFFGNIDVFTVIMLFVCILLLIPLHITSKKSNND
jgi:hypothetical protein